MTNAVRTLTDTMRAAILDAPGVVRLAEVPTPVPGPGQVLVRVAAVGVCGSDVHYWQDGRIGDFVVEAPLVLGHEAAGRIAAVGPGVDPTRLGQRVSVEPQHVCRRCRQCREGRYNLCESIEFFATPPIDGAFADYVLIDEDFAHPIPASVSLQAAALCEPLSVGIWSNAKADTRPGDRLLVAGAGPIGLVVTQVAKVYGAAQVIVADPVASRREVALRLGADAVWDPADGEIEARVDAFVDASGSERAIDSGIRAVRPGGHAVLVGMGPAEDQVLPVATIRNRELQVTGVFRYAHTWPAAIGMLAHGQVDLDALVTARFPLAETEAALRSAASPEGLKTMVLPDPEDV